MSETLFTHYGDNVLVYVSREADGTIGLQWSDVMCNDWAESYPAEGLSAALARAALLVRFDRQLSDPDAEDGVVISTLFIHADAEGWAEAWERLAASLVES